VVAGQDRLTLGAWLAEYAAEFYRARSYRMVWSAIENKHLPRVMADVPLSAVRGIDWPAWVAAMSEDLAPATVHLYQGMVQRALDCAVDRGLIPSNPSRAVRLPRLGGNRPYIEPDDLPAFVREAMRERWHFGRLMVVMALTGLRISEACALTWEHVDLERRRLTVAEQLVGGKRRPPKSSSGERTLALPGAAVTALTVQRGLTDRIVRRMSPRRRPEPSPVFVTVTGRPITQPQCVRRELRAVCDVLGLPDMTPHALRHTYATAQIAGGADLAHLSKTLGHRHVQTTVDQYGHLTASMARDAADRMDELLDG